MRRTTVLSGIFVTSLAACQKPGPPADSVPGARDEPAASSDRPAVPGRTERDAAADDSVTMRYACEQGHEIEIVGGDTARIRLNDGRVVEIVRVADSSPPRYSGEALSFDVASTGGTLGQHEVGGFSCREAD